VVCLDDMVVVTMILPSSLNQDENAFITKNLPSAHDTFGSNLNDDDDNDIPFNLGIATVLFFKSNCSICIITYLDMFNNINL
jgi:hypothetical protein